MSTIEKLKKKFYGSPTPNDLTTDDIKRLADHYNCKYRTGGNHQIAFYSEITGMVVPLPQHGKGIKQEYIKQLRVLFDDEEMKG